VLLRDCELQAPNDPPDEGDGKSAPFGGFPLEHEDLPYKVELWDESGTYVEHIVAVSANPAVGFAAYYAAAREFPGRDITLRHKDRVLSRWTGRSH
jgi:hypothetical protein